MFTTTGPVWLCHGNWAPGCTVYLATTVREGSSTVTTVVASPFSLILSFRSTSAVTTDRRVSASAAIGGGGSCAADGTMWSTPAVARVNSAIPSISLVLLRRLSAAVIGLLLSRRIFFAERR